MLQSETAIDTARELLGDGTAFWRPGHTAIYRCALRMRDNGELVDVVTIADRLEQDGHLDRIEGGRSALYQLPSLAPTWTNVATFARIVAERGFQRALIRAGGEISRLGFERPGDSLQLLDQAHALVQTLDHPGAQGELALPLREFLAQQLEIQPALLGTEDDTIIPAGGLAILSGMAGVGKTTLALDAAFHLATGIPWLGFPANKPLNILLIENEGPQHKFQEKLRAKEKTWRYVMQGEITVQTWRWGAFNFTDTTAAHLLRQHLNENDIDLIIGDPLTNLGVVGVGAPDDTRTFVRHLTALGLTNNRSFFFLHHPRKELSAEELNQLSGAWAGHLDTLLVLKATDNRDELRLSFPKVRWGEEMRDPYILEKIRETASFELTRRETHEPAPSDDAVEETLHKIVAVLRQRGGALERQIIALHTETEPTNRTFNSALARGYQRDILAKEREGRTTRYSLSPDAYL